MTHLTGYTIAVTDLDETIRWYTAHLGLRETGRFDLPPYDLHGATLGSDDGWSIEVLHRAQTAPKDAVAHPLDAALTAGYVTIQLDVSDLEGTFASLVAGGAKPLMPPHPGPAGFAAVLADPEGNLIRIRAQA